MATVRPFKGVRYNPEEVLLKHVIAPPYDVISSEYRETLVNRSPLNVAAIDLPAGEDKYAAAARTYENWIAKGTLITDTEPAFYLYEQEYDYNDKHYVRTGFIGLLRLEPLSEGVVFPHEKTLSGPKQDRLELMTASKANFSSVFGLYIDDDDTLKTIFSRFHHEMPIASAVDDDKVKHSLWIIKDKEAIQQISAFMKDKAVYIADGHHRYETALVYRDIMRKKYGDSDFDTKPYDYVMMTFVNCYDHGLLILPTHRVVDEPDGFAEDVFLENLSVKGVVKELESLEQASEFLEELTVSGRFIIITKEKIVGIYLSRELLESLNPFYREVDTYLLQKEIFEDILKMTEEQILAKKGIYFYQNPTDVLTHVRERGGIGVLLNSVNIDTIKKLSENGQVMPQKSTFFYPKLATGLLFNRLD
jgi:uncharacterized protein (DUF1015 family)